jgi:hypothetical protein
MGFSDLSHTNHFFAFVAMIKQTQIAQFHGHQIVSGLVISHPVPKRLLILGEFFPAVLERL